MKLLPNIIALCVAPAVVAGQSLRGSHASVELMYTSAHEKDLAFLHTRGDIYDAAVGGDLALITINEDVTLERVSFPFVLPSTRAFVDSLGAVYHAACGERLTVTSGARPIAEQPRNASPQSVHPTGMAVDFRKPSGTCLTWLRAALIDLEKRGVIEATEEHHPPHFHVAVLHQRLPKPRAVIAAASATSTAAARNVSRATTQVSEGEVTTTPSKSKGTRYTVRAGDNLWTIARRHGTTTDRLQRMNGLETSRLRVGQVLKLP